MSREDGLNVCVFACSPVGRMAMQFVAAQMMSSVWNGPSTSQVMKPSVSAVFGSNHPALYLSSAASSVTIFTPSQTSPTSLFSIFYLSKPEL